MKERIIRLMTTKKLTAIRFAEIMGVRPSSISHIMSGRNNPSYDFILKVLENFPDVSPDWFILGKGNMYRTEEHSQSDLLEQEKEKEDNASLFEDEDTAFATDLEEDPIGLQMENEKLSPPLSLPNHRVSAKHLQRVILLYNDGSFESFETEK